MAIKFVDEADLTTVGNAIRAKTGGSDLLTFPEGMAEAIAGISGGGGDDGSLKAIIERTAVNPTLPSDLTQIGSYAFTNCPKLALTSLPSGVTSIGNSAFNGCTGLTSITFQGKPTKFASSAFGSCPNLTTINVPWAGGAVTGAPWGATNATINYNYTGG